MAQEPDGTLITLLDENGAEHEFEHLASLEYNGSSYVALVPAYAEPEEILGSDGQLVILKIIPDEQSGEDVLASIEDDDEFYAVSEKFEEILDEDYDIIEEESEEDTE